MGGKEGKGACCLVTSVNQCCGSGLPMCRSDFTAKLQDFLGEGFQDFQSLDSQGKSSFVLGSELREENFSSLLELVKCFAYLKS